MESSPFQISIALLGEIKSHFKTISQVTREAIRLVALNSLITARYGNEASYEMGNSPVFRELSYNGELSGLDEMQVLETAKDVAHSIDVEKWRVATRAFATRDFADLLSYTHSMSSFALRGNEDSIRTRKSIGAFYTTRSITDYIVKHTIGPLLPDDFDNDHKSATFPRIMDPACGTGAFLISAAELIKHHYESRLWIDDLQGLIRDSLFGIDLDAGALEIARVSLEVILQSSDPRFKKQRDSPSLRKGNSLISIRGMNGASAHGHFFADSSFRVPLEWCKEFPEVLGERPYGFDAVVMNPPYQRLKPNFAEFLRDRLLSGSRAIQIAEYESHKKRIAEDVKYFRESGEFSLGNKYTIDTYRLFIERALQITRLGGRIGFIVPSSLLGDISAMKLRQHLLNNSKIELVREFSESGRLFSGVTQSVCIMVAEKGGKTGRMNANFGLEVIDDAIFEKGFMIHFNEILKFAGNSNVIPRVPSEGLPILDKLHQHPTMDSLPWLTNKRGELDLTLSKRYILGNSSGQRLVRGSHVARYSLLPPTKNRQESVDFNAFLKSIEVSTKAKDTMNWRIACQQVSNRQQKWRLKFALVPPKSILANSCNYIVVTDNSTQNYLFYLLGILNSHLMNWRFEVSNTNNHVSNRELSRLPIPDPQGMTKDELESFRAIVKLARKRVKEDEAVEPLLEATVLNLFGLSERESSRVLTYRGVNALRKKEILRNLRQ